MRAALLAFCAVCASAFADDFKLTDGREYKDVKVSRVEPDGLIVGTESGVVKLFFVELAKDVQEKYQYDPKKAEAFRFRLDAARDAAADEVAAAAERQKSAQGGGKPSNPAPTPPDENRAVRSLSLEAHEIGTADGYQSYWETDWGSYDRDYARGKRILVTIHDISRKVPKVQIDVYFIARPVLDNARHFVYDHHRLFPHMRGRLEVSGPVAAADLHARVLNLALSGRKYGKGANMDGWIVIGRVGNQTFSVQASSRTLFAIAQEDPHQAERLTDLIAEYEAAQRPAEGAPPSD